VDAIRHVAAAAGFSSREPQLMGGRRTSRNAQLNLKARPDMIAASAPLPSSTAEVLAKR